MSPGELRGWYEDYLDVCNRHDLTALRAFLQPGVRRAHLASGADAWLDGMRDLFGAFPDFRWTRVGVVVEGDRLAAHLRASGTHRGAFLGVGATGRHVNVAEFAFYRIADGRIAEYAGTGDSAELLAQLTR